MCVSERIKYWIFKIVYEKQTSTYIRTLIAKTKRKNLKLYWLVFTQYTHSHTCIFCCVNIFFQTSCMFWHACITNWSYQKCKQNVQQSQYLYVIPWQYTQTERLSKNEKKREWCVSLALRESRCNDIGKLLFCIFQILKLCYAIKDNSTKYA